MHFGEYELSPSLIGLSPLPSSHPGAFQRPLVRSSIRRYPDFNLDKGRSHGFASARTDSDALFGLAFAADTRLSRLALPDRTTRRFIMQKARRHGILPLRPLVGARFQDLFHPPARGAFHLSLTVLVHYRSLASI